MPLDKVQLKADIKEAFVSQRNKTSDPEAAIEDLAEKLANAFDKYTKGIKINYTSGLMAGNVTVTGIFNHTTS